MHRAITIPLSAIALLLSLAACSVAPSSADQARIVEIGDDAILLDVRTAQEFASGHLDGAKLLDFNAGDLAAAIPNLDPHAEYLVYCRSGNRSGQAIALMEQAGFTNLTNLGSLDQAAQATGLPIID
jgi:phage shock protein E